MPENILSTVLAPNSATPGKRRTRVARDDCRHIVEARAPSFSFNRPETWPPLLRERDICRDPKRNYPGIVPVTRSAWRDLMRNGYVSEGVKIGAKVRAWTSTELLEIVRNGVAGRREQGRWARECTAPHTENLIPAATQTT